MFLSLRRTKKENKNWIFIIIKTFLIIKTKYTLAKIELQNYNFKFCLHKIGLIAAQTHTKIPLNRIYYLI